MKQSQGQVLIECYDVTHSTGGQSRCVNVDLPSDENSPNHNSNTTTSIMEKSKNDDCLNELWAIISKFLK